MWKNDAQNVLDLIEEPGQGLVSTPGFRTACLTVFTPDALIIQGQTRQNVVAVSTADGYLLWTKTKFDHKGRYIRLAYADDLQGPWHIHEPGSLQIAGSHFLTTPPDVSADELERLRASPQPANLSHDLLTERTTPHIASPDVHVDTEHRRIVMYFHGLEGLGRQATRVATSADGLRFETRHDLLGRTYLAP